MANVIVSSAIDTLLRTASIAAARDTLLPELAVTTNTTLGATHYSVSANATSGSLTITLPAVSGITGRRYQITKSDASANTVTIDGNASETINGATTHVLRSQYESITIKATTAGWIIDSGGVESTFDTSLVDDTDSTYIWFGGLVGAAWQINRFTIATSVKAVATIANNPSYANLAAAWASKHLLTCT